MTTFVVLDPIRFLPAGIEPIDIDTDFHDTDVISVSLPAYPLANVTAAQSFMYITSNPDGDFDIGPTDAVAFSQTTVALISGNSEFRFPRSLLTTIDKQNVTGVRFKIQASSNCTVKIGSVRLLSSDWVYSPIDQDTLWGRLERPVSLTADPATASSFPVGTGSPGSANMALGGDFESAADLARYSATTATLALNTSEHTNGISSCRATLSAATGKLIGDPNIIEPPVATNVYGAAVYRQHTYTVKAKVKGLAATTANVGFRVYDDAGVLLSQPAATNTTMDGTWKTLTYTRDIKAADATALHVGVLVNFGGISTNQFYVDELELTYVPSDWPIIFKADIPTGSGDPAPIDVDASVYFASGSLTETVAPISDGDPGQANEFALFFREQPADYLTQLDLDGSFDQSDLDAIGHQPDYGRAAYMGRTQTSLDQYTQDDLDFFTQFDAERLQDTTASVWVKAHMRWHQGGASLEISDTEGSRYLFEDFDFIANRHYILFASLEDDAMHCRIFEADELGTILWDTMVLDTGAIIDSTLFVRRKGRFGWWGRFQDGDAYVNNIRTRGINYAEYRSAPFESLTPVVGANLAIGGTVNKELYDGVSPSPWGGRLDLDPAKSSSGEAVKVTNLQNVPLQGLMTNEILFDDFDETTIDFNLWFPKYAVDGGAHLEAFLLGENVRLLPLHVPILKTDQWHKVSFNPISACEIQTGLYRLVLIQTVANVPTVWWVDKMSIRTRVTSWSGRATQGGAWGMEPHEWVPFRDTVNRANDGIIFADRANRLQVRGYARRQDARISSVKATPKYAELGRFIWDEDVVTYPPVTAAITSIVLDSGLTYTCTATPDDDFRIYQWDFDDDTRDYGPVLDHTFPRAGTYDVTLTVVDSHGMSATVTQTVTA